MSTSSLYCVLCIFHLGSRGREWRMKMPSKGYKLLLSSLLLLTWWPMHPSLSLSLSHTITHSECAEVMQLQVSTYLRSWLHHSSHHLSRAHPLWTAISFSGNPAEDEPMEKKRQEGRSCLCSASHAYIYPSLLCHFLESNEENYYTYLFIYIYVFIDMRCSVTTTSCYKTACVFWKKRRRCKILGTFILLRVLEKKWRVDVDIPCVFFEQRIFPVLGSWHSSPKTTHLRIYHHLIPLSSCSYQTSKEPGTRWAPDPKPAPTQQPTTLGQSPAPHLGWLIVKKDSFILSSCVDLAFVVLKRPVWFKCTTILIRPGRRGPTGAPND